jgi:hypothetical protein
MAKSLDSERRFGPTTGELEERIEQFEGRLDALDQLVRRPSGVLTMPDASGTIHGIKAEELYQAAYELSIAFVKSHADLPEYWGCNSFAEVRDCCLALAKLMGVNR